MRLLLDSHYCFWLTLKRDQLRAPELAVILDPTNDIAFSSVTIWELRIKWERRYVSGERKGEANPKDVLDALREAELPAIDLSPELAVTTLREPIAHGDPFDALLLAVAQETDRRLLTRDGRLKGHSLAFHVA